jgi:predicted Zn-dependent peptidase
MALDLVGSDPDSHLFQEVRERLGLGYDVSASLEWGPDWGLATIAASAGRSAGTRLLRAIDTVCERARDEGFGDEELKRARRKVRYRYASLAESRLDRAVALAEGDRLGFPPPEAAARLVEELDGPAIHTAWRAAIEGRTLSILAA